MILTTLLLILAVLAMDWQKEDYTDKVSTAVVTSNTTTDTSETNQLLNTSCCLEHALEAAEAGRLMEEEEDWEGLLHTFSTDNRPILFLGHDPAKRVTAIYFRKKPQPAS
ncbi:hypothetical protein [Pontibacter korlensis]|nr:hypothetical protein [Pontibacter korlensis]